MMKIQQKNKYLTNAYLKVSIDIKSQKEKIDNVEEYENKISKYEKMLERRSDYDDIKNDSKRLIHKLSELHKQLDAYKELEIINQKYISQYNGFKILLNDIENEKTKFAAIREKNKTTFLNIQEAIKRENKKYEIATERLVNLNLEIQLHEKIASKFEYTLYEPTFSNNDPESYKKKIQDCVKEQKLAIKNKYHITNNSIPYPDESDDDFKKRSSAISTNMVNLIDKESETIISKVTLHNANKLIETIEANFKSLNRINSISLFHNFVLSNYYLDLKKEEIKIKFEFALAKQKAKEQQEDIRAQMREEQKEERRIQKEIEQAKIAQQKAEADELIFMAELEKAREDLKRTMEAQHNMRLEEAQNRMSQDSQRKDDEMKLKEEEMNLMIAQLEIDLKTAQEAKERNKSMAQQTRAGHVYVISNIGSFGEGVVKIGMTRRLEPLDRVKELGDASVPFGFDIHAMIYAKDAPALESELHKQFADNRINLVNLRKEFFRVHVNQIKEYLLTKDIDSDFFELPTASEYFESCSIRNMAESHGISISSIIKESDLSMMTQNEELEELEETV